MKPDQPGRPVKIAIIGAGSAELSMSVVRDVCLIPAFSGSEVWFIDIETTRLDAIDRLARRYAAELGVDLHFVPPLFNARMRERVGDLHELSSMFAEEAVVR